MNIGIVIRKVSVLTFPHSVRKLPERQYVDLLFEKQAIVEGQPFAVIHFFFDVREAGFSFARHDHNPSVVE